MIAVLRQACLLALLSGSAAAQGLEGSYDPSILDDCMTAAKSPDAQRACIGVGAEACTLGEGGSTTIGYGYCFGSEGEDWDARLNAVYQTLLPQQARLHEDLQSFNPDFSNPQDRMRDMQRNWIAYRDAACDWEYLQWSGGTGGGPAIAQCLMELTALQTIFLMQRTRQ